MSKDLLEEYFSRQGSVEIEPRDGFKEELIRNLKSRVRRLERRRLCYAVLSILSALAAIVLLGLYLHSLEITLFVVEISPLQLILAALLFLIIFVASYLINAMELKKLRQRLTAMD